MKPIETADVIYAVIRASRVLIYKDFHINGYIGKIRHRIIYTESVNDEGFHQFKGKIFFKESKNPDESYKTTMPFEAGQLVKVTKDGDLYDIDNAIYSDCEYIDDEGEKVQDSIVTSYGEPIYRVSPITIDELPEFLKDKYTEAQKCLKEPFFATPLEQNKIPDATSI